MEYRGGYGIIESDFHKENIGKNVKYALIALGALITATSNNFSPAHAQEITQTERVVKKDSEPIIVAQETQEAPEPIETFLERNNMQDALREYWRGVRKLQYSAQQDTSERMSAFIVSPDGAFEWVDGELTETSNEDDDVKRRVLFSISTEFLEGLYGRLENNNRAALFHTHPTHYFLTRRKTDGPDIFRIPPSPTDMRSLLSYTQAVSPDAFDRLTFVVVTEQKTWRYGFSTREAALHFRDTFSADAGFSEMPKFYNFRKYIKRWEGVGAFLEEESLLPAQDF